MTSKERRENAPNFINRVDSRAMNVNKSGANTGGSAEWGHLAVLEAVIKALKPNTIVELGAAQGFSAGVMGKAVQSVGYAGHVYALEKMESAVKQAKARVKGLPVSILHENYNKYDFSVHEPIHMAHIDANWNERAKEVKILLPFLHEEAILVLHDMGNDSPGHAAIPEIKGLGFEIVEFLTPRGTVVAKRPTWRRNSNDPH